MNSIRRRSVVLGLAAGVAGAAHAQAAGYEEAPWPAGLPTPALDAPDLRGVVRTLAEFRGRAVLLNFWASWCAPCRTELPSLAQLAQFHGGDELAVLAINFKESAGLVRRFLEPRGIDLQVLLDPEGAVAARWGVKIFPTTVLVDAAGRARWRVRGERDWAAPDVTALLHRTKP